MKIIRQLAAIAFFTIGPVFYEFVIYPLIPEEYLTYSGIPDLPIMMTLFIGWVMITTLLMVGLPE